VGAPKFFHPFHPGQSSHRAGRCIEERERMIFTYFIYAACLQSIWFLGKNFRKTARRIVLSGCLYMKKVITYGTYDLLHRGHINLLRRARALGDHLIVALSTDAFNAVKGKQVYYPFEERKLVLEAVRYVDEVISEKYWEQKINDVLHYKIDVFVMGDDWQGKFDFLKPYCEVIYLPRTEGISTSQIKLDLSGNFAGTSSPPTK
jgi:glycerol-3-phosphate cytidylyltransferase